MPNGEIDNILSGVIVLLLIVVVWKWYIDHSTCGKSNMTLSCGCSRGMCRCIGMSRIALQARCPGGRQCPCGHSAGRCGCPQRCMCQQMAVANAKAPSKAKAEKEGLETYKCQEGMCGERHEGMKCGLQCRDPKIGTPGYEPKVVQNTGDYSGDVVQKMALEPEVMNSQKDYVNGLGFAGLPTGASHETTLEEMGRSANTSNFVGLTARKWCKSRQLATPASDSRVVPTETIKEFCNIDMHELV